MIRTGAIFLCTALFATPVWADDDADLKATTYFKSCDAASFATEQCLCFAQSLSHGGRGIDPVLLNALEEELTLKNEGQATMPGVHAALAHRTPPISASDDKLREALLALVKATHKCAKAE